jgi:hypothetical protein
MLFSHLPPTFPGSGLFRGHDACPSVRSHRFRDSPQNQGRVVLVICRAARDLFDAPGGWIESVTAECREKLAPLFHLTVGERAFLDAILVRGEIDASSLGVPERVRAAIEASPALRWKAQNV